VAGEQSSPPSHIGPSLPPLPANATLLSVPVSDWFVGNTVSQSMSRPQHEQRPRPGGLLIQSRQLDQSLLAHPFNRRVNPAASCRVNRLQRQHQPSSHVWPVNAVDLYGW
jgi:hypothetical protein